jgi:hypothetical protein
MYDTHFILLAVTAVYLLSQGIMMTAHTTFYAFAFRVFPIIMSFVLGLMAFKVI